MDLKTCQCGARFKRSRTDSTVRCPDCRGGRRRSATRPSTSRKIQAIKAVEDYALRHYCDEPGDITPVIAQAFHPDKGWTTYPIKKRISVAWAIKMRREGYTKVALRIWEDRLVDFSLQELVREYSALEWATHEKAMRELREFRRAWTGA